MQVDSIYWLFWMWLTVGLYWLVAAQLRLPLLVAITAAFIATVSPLSLLLLSVFTLTSHVASRRENPSLQETLVGTGLVLVVLAGFKIHIALSGPAGLTSVIIPLGLSYYSFRCIHFMVERYKGHIGAVRLTDLVGYLFFLPTILVGPIHRIEDYLYDLRRQRFDPAMISEGAERILYGYAKVAILSNFLVNGMGGVWIGGLSDQDGRLVAYLLMVQGGLNLYLQFSGYSDIAIGFARLLGFKVMENFNWPYLQPNISAFWRCWHISLSRWCRDYIYDVIVSMTRSPALGAMSVMIGIGLWHEISFRFLYWGVYHGLGLIIWQQWDRRGPSLPKDLPKPVAFAIHALKVLVTVHFVWFGFMLLDARDLADTLRVFSQFFAF